MAYVMTRGECYTQLMCPQCVCGAGKQPRRSFCRACYYALPAALRKGLWSPIGGGYAESYASAIDKLKETGRLVIKGI